MQKSTTNARNSSGMKDSARRKYFISPMTHVMAVNIQPIPGQLLYVPVMSLFMNHPIILPHAGLHQVLSFPLRQIHEAG